MREKLEEIRAARVEQEIRVQEASNLFLKVNKEIRFQISGFDDTVHKEHNLFEFSFVGSHPCPIRSFLLIDKTTFDLSWYGFFVHSTLLSNFGSY